MTRTPTLRRPIGAACRRRTGATLAIAAAAIILSGWGARPAFAHTELMISAPAAGAQLGTAPNRITLTFTDRVVPQFHTVTLTINDQPEQTLTSQVDGPKVIADVPAGSPAGRWEIRYRVVAEDGHPILDTLTFTVAPQPAPRSPSPPPSAPPDDPRSLTPVPSPPADRTTPSPTIARWLIAVGILGFFTVPLLAAKWSTGYARSAATAVEDPPEPTHPEEAAQPGIDPDTHDQRPEP